MMMIFIHETIDDVLRFISAVVFDFEKDVMLRKCDTLFKQTILHVLEIKCLGFRVLQSEPISHSTIFNPTYRHFKLHKTFPPSKHILSTTMCYYFGPL